MKTRIRHCLSGFLLLVMLLGTAPCGFSQEAEEGPVFKLNVSKGMSLPPAMYGTWSITATVLKTTAPPWLYAPAGSEVWSLSRENDAVTLKNVVTTAFATVQVDKVEGNTATFHHVANAVARKIKVIETPTITVDGDKLSGINRQEVFFYNRNNQIAQTHTLEIKVEGTRLSGDKVRFGDPEEYKPTEFEIAPVQVKD